MMDLCTKRPAETKVSRSDSEHLLPIHRDSRVGSAATPLPLLDFFGAIRKSTERFTRIHWLNPKEDWEARGSKEIWIWELESKNRSKTVKENGSRWGKTQLPFYFIVALAKRYNTQKNDSQLPNAEKTDFLRYFFFFKITFWKKENTHIPCQLLDFTFFYWDYIPG